jgi:hypothetical protein
MLLMPSFDHIFEFLEAIQAQVASTGHFPFPIHIISPFSKEAIQLCGIMGEWYAFNQSEWVIQAMSI